MAAIELSETTSRTVIGGRFANRRIARLTQQLKAAKTGAEQRNLAREIIAEETKRVEASWAQRMVAKVRRISDRKRTMDNLVAVYGNNLTTDPAAYRSFY